MDTFYDFVTSTIQLNYQWLLDNDLKSTNVVFNLSFFNTKDYSSHHRRIRDIKTFLSEKVPNLILETAETSRSMFVSILNETGTKSEVSDEIFIDHANKEFALYEKWSRENV